MRLPIERLDVVPLPSEAADGDNAVTPAAPGSDAAVGSLSAGGIGAAIPGPEGAVRLAWVRGPPPSGSAGRTLTTWLLGSSGVRALLVGGPASAATGWVEGLRERDRDAPLAVAHVAGEGPGAPLRVVHDPESRLPWGDADGGLLVVDGVALLPLASADTAPDDARVAGLASRLSDAAPYTSRIIVSWKSLSAWTDEDPELPLAYRIYEHALREEAHAFVSFAANVPCDGRYGGLTAVSVGPAERGANEPCHALRGSRTCVPGAMTLIDVPRDGPLRVRHAGPTAAGAVRALGDDAFPATIGRYRR